LTDDKLFDFIVARSRTRETSTLTIATIAASASLILLALYFQADQEQKILILIMGILFPSLGIAYREVTNKTIHEEDQTWIRKYLLKNLEDAKKNKN